MNREAREVIAYACGNRSKETCQILWDRIPSTYKKPWFLPLIRKRVKLLFRMNSIFLAVKKQEKRPMLSAGIIPYVSNLTCFVRKTLSIPKCIIMHEICLKLFLSL